MIYLTEISVPRKAVVDAAMTYDPLVASDMDYCLKIWMADKPSIACRPWRASSVRDGVRISGWRREAPGSAVEGAYVGTKDISLLVGRPIALAGRFIALRRVKSMARAQPQAAQIQRPPTALGSTNA
jgi:hypothetical protein